MRHVSWNFAWLNSHKLQLEKYLFKFSGRERKCLASDAICCGSLISVCSTRGCCSTFPSSPCTAFRVLWSRPLVRDDLRTWNISTRLTFSPLISRPCLCTAQALCGSVQHLLRLRTVTYQQEHSYDSNQLCHDCLSHLATDALLLLAAPWRWRPPRRSHLCSCRFLRHALPSGRSGIIPLVQRLGAHHVQGETLRSGKWGSKGFACNWFFSTYRWRLPFAYRFNWFRPCWCMLSSAWLFKNILMHFFFLPNFNIETNAHTFSHLKFFFFLVMANLFFFWKLMFNDLFFIRKCQKEGIITGTSTHSRLWTFSSIRRTLSCPKYWASRSATALPIWWRR